LPIIRGHVEFRYVNAHGSPGRSKFSDIL
jgi:hypothetical protein